FNLVRREAYVTMGSFEALRLEVVDDLKFGEAIKRARLRQDVVFGRGLVTLRWIEGAWGVVRILEKNLFAFLNFRVSLALAACVLLMTAFYRCSYPDCDSLPSERACDRRSNRCFSCDTHQRFVDSNRNCWLSVQSDKKWRHYMAWYHLSPGGIAEEVAIAKHGKQHWSPSETNSLR